MRWIPDLHVTQEKNTAMISAQVILVLIFAFLWLTYNGLIRARNMVREAWSGIDVQLKRRNDLIPNLVEAVKGYSGYERSLFEEIAESRTRTVSATSTDERAGAENALTQGIKSVFAVSEAYPDLKANTSFLDLQKNLVEIENQIQFARRYYNGAVRDLNIRVESFPANLVAQKFGFHSEKFFEVELATVREAPEVHLA
jgi:LemA protein